jgi:nitrogen regulatory protein PII
MVETAKVRLVTIIAGAELEDRLSQDLRQAGAPGQTLSRVEGRGHHGPRTVSFLDRGNVRIETLVAPTVAEKILERIVGQYAGLEIVAFVQDVEAIPRESFSPAETRR